MVNRLDGIGLVRISLDSQEIDGGKTDRKIAFLSQNFFSKPEKEEYKPAPLKDKIIRLVKEAQFKELNTITPLSLFPVSIDALRKVSSDVSSSFLCDSFVYAMVWSGNRLLFEESWGKDGIDNPLDSESIFRIGSLSKQVLAHLFLSLCAEKKINLEQKLVSFFPDRAFPSLFEKITLFHLLNHTSGLPTYKEDQIPKIFSSKELFEEMIEKPLQFCPGDYFLYSNVGYSILGYLFERITGSSFNKEIASLSRKMGLQSTGYLSQQQEQKWVIGHKKDAFHQVRQESDGSLHQTKAFSAAGLYSCAKDLREWYTRFLASELAFNSEELFKNSKTKVQFGDPSFKKIRYQFGFFLEGDCLNHTGFFPGYLSQIVLNPTQRSGLLILCGNEDADIISMKKELQIQFKGLFGE